MTTQIAIIAGDRACLTSVKSTAESIGFAVSNFADADAFIATPNRGSYACVVLCFNDVSETALTAHSSVRQQLVRCQSTIVVGQIDVQLAVSLMEGGALTVLPNSFNEQQLVRYLRSANSIEREKRAVRERIAELRTCRESLSERQLKILELVEQGNSNREIAESFDLSQRTIELERARLMDAFKSASVAQLVSKSTELRVLTDTWHPKSETTSEVESTGLSA